MTKHILAGILLSLLYLIPLTDFRADCSEEPIWHEFPFTAASLPIDLSGWLNPPAGKHGFLGVEGDRFVFEDGTEARFWGITLRGSGCFPPQSEAPELARTLAQYGINLVRFEALDADWADPVLIEANREGDLRLNPVAMDRLDFLIHQLANRGIYTSFVGLSERVALPRALRDWYEALEPGWPGAIHVLDELRSVHANWLEAFWSHINPYTQCQYRDCSFIVMHDLFEQNRIADTVPSDSRILAVLNRLWADWCEENQLNAEPLSLRFPSPEQHRFLAALQDTSQTEWKNILRLMSVKIPVGGTGSPESLWDLASAASMDYAHSDAEWAQPVTEFGPFDPRAPSTISAQHPESVFTRLAFARIAEKPFVVNGWGSRWPLSSRSEFPLWISAMAQVQRWNAVVSLPYRTGHDNDDLVSLQAGSMAGDPLVMGLMPTAALMFHRNELRQSLPEVVMRVSDAELSQGDILTTQTVLPPRLVDRAIVSASLGTHSSRATVLAPTETVPPDVMQRMKTPAGLIHDASNGLVQIQSSQTWVAIGALQRLHHSPDDAIQVVSSLPHGVVALTSLTSQPLASSNELWITIVTDARNRGFAWREQGDGFVIQRHGSEPIELPHSPIWLAMETPHARWAIHPIDARGEELPRIPYQWMEGKLSVQLGTHDAIWYRAERIEND